MVMQLAFPRLMGCGEKLPRHADWGRGDVCSCVYRLKKGGCLWNQNSISGVFLYHFPTYFWNRNSRGTWSFSTNLAGQKTPRIHLFLPTLLSAGLIDTCLSARLLHGCLGSELWSSYLWHRCFNQWLLNIEEMDPASLRKSHRDWIHFSHLPSPMQRLITWCSLLPFPSLKS